MCDIEEEELDPRVQIQLEKLNSCTDEINRLEVELDEANAHFRHTLSVSTQRLNILKKKLDKAIEAARPYYEAKYRAHRAQQECQKAAIQYQRASEIHQAATETIALAEQRFLSKQSEWAFDTAWQEMLNHATEKVTVAKTQMVESQSEHRRRAAVFKEAEECVKCMEEKLKSEIKKSRTYFEAKDRFERSLEEIKARIEEKRGNVARSKEQYNGALHALEIISSEIHERRKTRLELDIERKFRDSGFQHLTPTSSTSGDLCDQTIGRLLEGSMGQLTDEGYSQSQLGSDSYLASFDCSISQCSSIASSVSSLPEKLKDIEEALSSTPKKSKKDFVDVPLDD
ncbi:SH3 domain-binding protein 5 homolog [Galendromus occidentalis]|uniref:SH3 domain-binding protein 5 homolog n=1 Tax=Galendromus occidentalis TaxID=34638 RepID=A0AAJ6QT71_9ACAR|nr:SH3 domain-binding protein 5 homolog [Galendromus occidentalis]